MKYRIVVLSLIVAAIGGFGWYNARRLSEVRAKQRLARTEAGRLEIPAGQSDMVTRKSQPRRNPAPAANLLTPDDIAFMNELETARQNPGNAVPKVRERHAAMADRFKAMTPAQVRKYVAEVRANEDLAMEVRQRLVQLAVGTLLNEDPANGVDLYNRWICCLNNMTTRNSAAGLSNGPGRILPPPLPGSAGTWRSTRT
ncbi:MAG: hypothetical protein WCP45_16490 [Verrucomicrobiota bacterium]